ncbi:hypothetical protein [Streptomyces sp. NPDC058653]|uniref:hypothetical protein n=1 Tax=Streptomyces sp. NPDC058653 TaxID=3346576 RepID=UPI0036605CB7
MLLLIGLAFLYAAFSNPVYVNYYGAPPETIYLADSVAVITAITGLVTALGGACGGIAALILATRSKEPQSPSSPQQDPPPASSTLNDRSDTNG